MDSTLEKVVARVTAEREKYEKARGERHPVMAAYEYVYNILNALEGDILDLVNGGGEDG